MITRKQYLDKEYSHQEYYGQFVSDRQKTIVKRYIGEKRIKESKDRHFNDIPLKEWDRLPLLPSSIHNEFRAAGDYVTLAGMGCLYKEAARQVKEVC